jgi:hypothetical protein
VGEHLVLDDGCVLVDEDVFDGERGDFGEEDAPESVGYRGVETGEGEFGVVGGVLVELDVEGLDLRSVHRACRIPELGHVWDCCSRAYLLEVVQVPLMRLTRPVSGKVGRLLVGDCFGANTKRLAAGSAGSGLHIQSRVRTFRLSSSSAAGVDMAAVLSSRVVFRWGHVHKKFEAGADRQGRRSQWR